MLLVSLLFVAVINAYFLNSKFVLTTGLLTFIHNLYKNSYTIICMAMVAVQIYYPRHTSIWENVASITALIFVQTIIHHRSKVFTTSPEC